MPLDPPRTLVIVAWCEESTSLDWLLARPAFAVVDVEGTCSVDELTLHPAIVTARALGLPVLLAFEDPMNAHEFQQRCAAAKGQVL